MVYYTYEGREIKKVRYRKKERKEGLFPARVVARRETKSRPVDNIERSNEWKLSIERRRRLEFDTLRRRSICTYKCILLLKGVAVRWEIRISRNVTDISTALLGGDNDTVSLL